MSDELAPKPRGRGRGRPFEKGRSGNPGGRQPGSRNRATLAAAALLAGEAESLTRKAVEMALAGNPTALRLCLERLLAPCRERILEFSLPLLEAERSGGGEARGASPRDVILAMNAVISALACGEITLGEAERIAGMVGTFVGAIDLARKQGSGLSMLQILTADDDDQNNSDDDDWDDYEENGDYEEADDGDS